MTITLELTEEQERGIVESAGHRDEVTLRQILTQALEAVIEKLMGEPREELGQAQFEALADQLAVSFAASSEGLPLPDEALSRAGIYGDHP